MAWAPDYITATQLKSYARITDAADDAEIGFAITAASRAVDQHCNRQFGLVAAEARLYTAWYHYERCRWVVDVDDFQSVVGLVVTIGGVATTTFTKEPRNAAAKGKPWERIVFDLAPSATPSYVDNYEVSVVAPWGWTTQPVPVTQASLLQASRFLSRRDSPYGIAGSPEQGSELRLLSRVDPDVGVSLRGLVRPRAVG